MPRELTACEIDSIMVGATFLGAGGGGPLDTGRELLKKQTSGSYSIDLYSMAAPFQRLKLFQQSVCTADPRLSIGLSFHGRDPRKGTGCNVWRDGRLFGFSAKDQGEWYLWSRWSGVL